MFTRKPRRARAGFTLAEIMIGSALGSLVLAGVLTSYTMLARSGTRAVNYSMMESQTRRAFEQLGGDLRMASDIDWNSATSITLTVPNNYTTTGNEVTYAYNSGAKTFTMSPAPGGASGSSYILTRDVSSLTFSRYTRNNTAATTDASTKRVQLSISTRREAGGAATTETISSASFTMRNKSVL